MGKEKAPTIRADVELARFSVGLGSASNFRIWVIARHINRLENGSGKVSKKDIKAVLRQFKIDYTRQHINKLFRDGNDLFWNTDRKFLYLHGWKSVARALTQLAVDENPDLLSNKPGVKEMLLSPAGSLEQWEATIYAGWLAYRNDPKISRESLEKLFNRTPETLRRWEQDHLDGIVTIQTNYTQCADVDTMMKLNPARVSSYVAKTPEGYKVRLIWQSPNTYKTRGIKQHPHKGQAPKVRKAVNEQLQQPDNKWRVGLPVVKLYFDSQKRAKQHIKKHGGIVEMWRGRNKHKHGIYEATQTGTAETNATERVMFRTERRLRDELFISL